MVGRVREPVEPIGVTELLEALWWLPGPEQLSRRTGQRGFPGPIDVDRLDSAGWVGLGLSPRQAASAMRYRQGGRWLHPCGGARADAGPARWLDGASWRPVGVSRSPHP